MKKIALLILSFSFSFGAVFDAIPTDYVAGQARSSYNEFKLFK